jgi:hypothetical protein
MSAGRVSAFPLVDRYVGTRMGVDLSRLRPGRTVVVETSRRLQREQNYGYIRALWWSWFADGCSAVSVPPGAGEAVREIAENITGPDRLFEPALAGQLQVPVSAALARASRAGVDRVLHDRHLACNAELLRRHRSGDCRRIVDETIPPAEGLSLPTHCFPDGVAYGVVADGKVVSIAYAHRTGVMEDVIADLAVDGTAVPYRRRGYAKTAVSAVVEHFTRAGGEALWVCRPDNVAAIATAGSVGFLPYALTLVLSAPAPV